jgi:phosphate transport system permease protein
MMADTNAYELQVGKRLRRRQTFGRVFTVLLLLCTLAGLLMLTVLLVTVAVDGLAWIRPQLFTNFHSRIPEKAGMKSAIVGSFFVITMTALFSLPLGVGAAIYLEEYAPKNALTDFININISNLAGVPSVVYGMLGLVVFGRMFGLFEPDSFLVRWLKLDAGGRGGLELRPLGIDWLLIRLPFERSLLAGALTMTLLILPIVIIASREAIRAVPNSIREAAYGLGATRWQAVWRQVLPPAIPGILTGMILALSRAIGETAPLIIMGAFTYVPFLPESVWDQFTAMPIQIYNWVTLPQEEYRVHLAGAGILVLLAVLLSMNALAVYLRNRFERKW